MLAKMLAYLVIKGKIGDVTDCHLSELIWLIIGEMICPKIAHLCPPSQRCNITTSTWIF